jgi:type I restriction enzyme M protein
MSNHNEISSFIWNVCDDVLRGLDCVIEPKKDEIIELYNELKDEVDPTPIIKKQTGIQTYQMYKINKNNKSLRG